MSVALLISFDHSNVVEDNKFPQINDLRAEQMKSGRCVEGLSVQPANNRILKCLA